MVLISSVALNAMSRFPSSSVENMRMSDCLKIEVVKESERMRWPPVELERERISRRPT